MIIQYILIGIGGSLGAVSRFLIESLVHNISSNSVFPYGTLAVNILGCLIIGFMFGLINTTQLITSRTRLFVITGFLGALTTFSSFGHDTFSLIENGLFFLAGLNILVQVITGLIAVWLGLVISKYLVVLSKYVYLKKYRVQ